MKIRDAQSRTGTMDSGAVNVTVKDILIGDIDTKENIRKQYNGLEELQASIKEHGLLQMITVYAVENGYAVKFGHRRFLAYQNLHKEDPEKYASIRCIISDADKIAVNQLVENVQREDLSQLDLVFALAALKDEGMTIKQIADVIGKAEGYMKNLFMGVNEIVNDDDLREIISHNVVTIIEIMETKGIPNRQERLDLLKKREKGDITRAGMKEMAKALKGGKTAAEPQVIIQDCPITPLPANIVAITEGPSASLDVSPISVTPDTADIVHTQVAPDYVSIKDKPETDRIQVSIKRYPEEMTVVVCMANVDDEQVPIVEKDLREFYNAKHERYKLM